jgi:hypothetical protein
VAAIFWSCAAVIVYQFVTRPSRWRASFVVGLAVFSHWVLDFIVHQPDLPLYGDSVKVGLGLWNAPALAFGLEAALLFGGMWFYLRGRLAGSLGTLAFGVLMLGSRPTSSLARPRYPTVLRRRPRSSRTPFSQS